MIRTEISALYSRCLHHICVPRRRKNGGGSCSERPTEKGFCPILCCVLPRALPDRVWSRANPHPTLYPIRRDLNSLNKIAGVGIDGIREGEMERGRHPFGITNAVARYTKKRVRGSALWQWSLSLSLGVTNGLLQIDRER